MMAEVVPESPLEPTDDGLVPAGEGWFVVSARDARWVHRPGRGFCLPLTGWTDDEVEQFFPQVGVNVFVLAPGDTIGVYHRKPTRRGSWSSPARRFCSSRARSGCSGRGTMSTARPERSTSCSEPARVVA
jgi:hypothetical protein